MTQTHIPKGSLCAVCVNSGQACAHLPFDTMQVIQTYADGIKAVRCTSFAKQPVVQLLPADDAEGGTNQPSPPNAGFFHGT